jgi:hypothetical protein
VYRREIIHFIGGGHQPARAGGTTVGKELRSIDISNVPDLVRIAEEVRRTGEPRLLRRDSEDVALLMPVAARPVRARSAVARRPPSPEEVARSRTGIEAAAGSWKDVDADALKAYIRERRDASSRPPVRLRASI